MKKNKNGKMIHPTIQSINSTDLNYTSIIFSIVRANRIVSKTLAARLGKLTWVVRVADGQP